MGKLVKSSGLGPEVLGVRVSPWAPFFTEVDMTASVWLALGLIALTFVNVVDWFRFKRIEKELDSLKGKIS